MEKLKIEKHIWGPKHSRYMDVCMEFLPLQEEAHHQCEECTEVLYSENLKRQHYNKMHNLDYYGYNCRFCNRQYTTAGTASSHEQQNHPEENQAPTLQCEKCKRMFKYEGQLRAHTVCMVPKNACGVCGKQYSNASALHKHALRHDEPKYKCELCEKTYFTKTFLKIHLEGAHSGELNYVCDLCGLQFRYRKGLNGHTRNVHCDKSKYYECDCGAEYLNVVVFRAHRRRKHRKEPISNLQDYERDMDLTVKIPSHVCDICLKVCNNAIKVRYHKRHTHNVDQNNVPLKVKNKRIFKNKKCFGKQRSKKGTQNEIKLQDPHESHDSSGTEDSCSETSEDEDFNEVEGELQQQERSQVQQASYLPHVVESTIDVVTS